VSAPTIEEVFARAERMVGRKVAITSDRPQTTRRVLRGIVNRPEGQLIMVDTPGLHRPRTLLGERLNDQVRETWSSVDVVGMCIPADQAEPIVLSAEQIRDEAPLPAFLSGEDVDDFLRRDFSDVPANPFIRERLAFRDKLERIAKAGDVKANYPQPLIPGIFYFSKHHLIELIRIT
jgi:GTPase Era involved in 16S rRNA processing